MTDKIFEIALKRKFRYDTSKGAITTEQLFDLPLADSNKPCLDTVARTIYTELRDISEGSFVDAAPNPRKDELTLKLEVVKHVIEAQKAEVAARRKAAERETERRKILSAIHSKKEEELSKATMDDLLARLASLD